MQPIWLELFHTPETDLCLGCAKATTGRKQDRPYAQLYRKIATKGEAMRADWIKVTLVIRTIGAERGRAARGRPETR